MKNLFYCFVCLLIVSCGTKPDKERDTSEKIETPTIKEWLTFDGPAEKAKHIVLATVPLNLDEIKSWGKPVIAVCKSGGRSHQATQFLKQNGLDVINGGPWQNVDQYLN